jgi:hypothetical protein
VYDSSGALIQNPAGRYQLSNTSPLAKNADGSVDIAVQATDPTDAAKVANWLPVASGKGFQVIWRLLAPRPEAIAGILDGAGWQPPVMLPA